MFILRVQVKNPHDSFTFEGEVGRRYIQHPCDTPEYTGKEAVKVALTLIEYELERVFSDEEIEFILEDELFNTVIDGVPEVIPEPVSVEHPHLTITIHNQYELAL